MVDLTSDEKKIKCINCHTVIIEYYNEEYNGYRGKCTVCKINFPLN